METDQDETLAMFDAQQQQGGDLEDLAGGMMEAMPPVIETPAEVPPPPPPAPLPTLDLTQDGKPQLNKEGKVKRKRGRPRKNAATAPPAESQLPPADEIPPAGEAPLGNSAVTGASPDELRAQAEAATDLLPTIFSPLCGEEAPYIKSGEYDERAGVLARMQAVVDQRGGLPVPMNPDIALLVEVSAYFVRRLAMKGTTASRWERMRRWIWPRLQIVWQRICGAFGL